MNIIFSTVIGCISLFLWVKFGSTTTFDYAISMRAAVVPAFLLGFFSTRKISYLLIAPTVSCLCILLPPWLEMHNTKLGVGSDAFFWVLIVAPGYYLLYMGASMLGYFLKSLAHKNNPA